MKISNLVVFSECVTTIFGSRLVGCVPTCLRESDKCEQEDQELGTEISAHNCCYKFDYYMDWAQLHLKPNAWNNSKRTVLTCQQTICMEFLLGELD